MSKIEEITNDLMNVSSEISSLDNQIERDQGEISNTMSKAQSSFGDQLPGQHFVSMLMKAMQSMVYANGELQGVKQSIQNYIQSIQK